MGLQHAVECLGSRSSEELDRLLMFAPEDQNRWSRSRLEQFKTVSRKESPEALSALIERLTEIRSSGLTVAPSIAEVHPATRRMLASWVTDTTSGVCAVHCSETVCDRVVFPASGSCRDHRCHHRNAGQAHHGSAQQGPAALRRSFARHRRSTQSCVEVLEQLGTLVLDESIPDQELRGQIFAPLPSDDITNLVEGCRNGAVTCRLVMRARISG